MSRVALPLLAFVAVLWTAPAAAQSLDLAYTSGVAVMGEPSSVTFTATNRTGRPIHEVVLKLKKPEGYELDGGEAPAGWVVSNIDRKNLVITFTADCTAAIPVGGSKDFSVRMVGQAELGDVDGQNFENVGSSARSLASCSGTTTSYPVNAASAVWRRVGLSAALVASPRTVPTGGLVTLRLDVTNRSTGTQLNITAPTPSVVGTAGFTLESASAAPLTLASGQTGSFSWTFRATSTGTAVFRASASNTGWAPVSSPVVDSAMVNVSNFSALAEVVPSRVIPGSTVTLQLVVANNTSEPVQAVSPTPPTFSGTATSTLVTGPTPASIAAVSPGATGTFTWTYTVKGPVGSTFQWTSQANGTQAGASLSTSQVSTSLGYLVAHQVTASPQSVLGGTAAAKEVTYTVFNGGDGTITQVELLEPDTVFARDANAFAADKSGWSWTMPTRQQGYVWAAPAGKGIAPGTSLAFTLRFASIGSVPVTTAYSHRMVLTETSGNSTMQSRVEASITVLANRVLPAVSNFTVVSANGRNVLTWTNPSDHDGVTVLRATTPVNATLEPGRTYALGETVGNAAVVYTDQASAASAFSDTNVQAGATYYYRVHNQDGYHFYASGAPTTGGLIATVTSGVSPSPAWCYSTGLTSLLQPFVASSPAGLFSSGNSTSLYSLITAPGGATDGTERWRPVSLAGPVQSRYPVTQLTGQSEPWVLVGDQQGNAYAVRASNGQQVWKQKLFGVIQAAPQVQQRSGSYDLVFFASAESTPTNGVVALRAATGATEWKFTPASLGKVSGTPTVDSANNHLVVAGRAGTSGGDSVYVLDTATGTLVKSYALGDSDYSVVRDAASNLALVTTNSGWVHGIDLTTLQVLLTVQVDTSGTSPAFSNFVFPVGKGFIASLKSGVVQRWALTQAQAGGPWQASLLWSSPALKQPSGVAVDFTNQKVFVGTGDGTLVQLNGGTGVMEASRSISGVQQLIGTPGLSSSLGRIHVGSADGRICAFPIPF